MIAGIVYPPMQVRHLSLHRRNVYGSRVNGSESVPVGSQAKYSSWYVYAALLSGTGGSIEVFAILFRLSVNAPLSYLLRGQLR